MSAEPMRAEHIKLHVDDIVRTERAGADETPLEWLMIDVGTRVRLVRTEDVDWIGAEDNYMRLHMGSDSCLIRETMGVLETRLDPKRFLRIHRSTIVNIARIKELHPWSNGDFVVVLRDGTELKLSRGYAARLGPHIGRYG